MAMSFLFLLNNFNCAKKARIIFVLHIYLLILWCCVNAMALTWQMDKENSNEKINDLVIDYNNGMYVRGIAICANHVYGKHDKDAQRAVLGSRETQPLWSFQYVGTR